MRGMSRGTDLASNLAGGIRSCGDVQIRPSHQHLRNLRCSQDNCSGRWRHTWAADGRDPASNPSARAAVNHRRDGLTGEIGERQAPGENSPTQRGREATRGAAACVNRNRDLLPRPENCHKARRHGGGRNRRRCRYRQRHRCGGRREVGSMGRVGSVGAVRHVPHGVRQVPTGVTRDGEQGLY